MEAISIPRPTSALTRRDAAVIWARAFNTRDCSYLSRKLAGSFSYISQWVEGDIESRDDYIEHLEAKLRTIRESAVEARAELAEMPPFPGSRAERQPCVMVDFNGNPLATVLFDVDGRNITKIEFCLNPAPDACNRQGIFPGLNVLNPAFGDSYGL